MINFSPTPPVERPLSASDRECSFDVGFFLWDERPINSVRDFLARGLSFPVPDILACKTSPPVCFFSFLLARNLPRVEAVPRGIGGIPQPFPGSVFRNKLRVSPGRVLWGSPSLPSFFSGPSLVRPFRFP